MKIKTFAAAIVLGLASIGIANASDELDKKMAEIKAHVASKFFDPGPSLVLKMLDRIRFFNDPDLGLNLTALTTNEIGNVLFPNGYVYGFDTSPIENRWENLAQTLFLRDIRQYFDSPENLQAVYKQVKAVAIPALLAKVGKTRVQTWLFSSRNMLQANGFNPRFGKSYEDWRTKGCQWHFQINLQSGYKPELSKEECLVHPFTVFIGGEEDPSKLLVNKAHWYGFLWRRYLEGDIGLVAPWQGILSDIEMASRDGKYTN